MREIHAKTQVKLFCLHINRRMQAMAQGGRAGGQGIDVMPAFTCGMDHKNDPTAFFCGTHIVLYTCLEPTLYF